jgi:hypothetical protein
MNYTLVLHSFCHVFVPIVRYSTALALLGITASRFFVVASAPSSTLAFHDGLTVFDAGLAQRVVFTQDRAFAQNIHRKIWST